MLPPSFSHDLSSHKAYQPRREDLFGIADAQALEMNMMQRVSPSTPTPAVVTDERRPGQRSKDRYWHAERRGHCGGCTSKSFFQETVRKTWLSAVEDATDKNPGRASPTAPFTIRHRPGNRTLLLKK